MYRSIVLLAAAVAVAVAVAVPTGLAAGSTQVTHFSFTTPPHLTCGILGTAVIHGTNVFRDTGDGTSFMSGTWFGVFTAADLEGQPRSPIPRRSGNVAARDRRAGGDGHDHDYRRGSV